MKNLFLSFFLFSSFLFIGNKLLAQNTPRLIAKFSGVIDPNNPIQIHDSIHYSYSGTRGGDLNSILKFDSATFWTWNYNTNSFNFKALSIQAFDSSNNIIADTFKNVAGLSLVNSFLTLYSYNATNIDTFKKTLVWDQLASAWVNAQQFSYTYNILGQLISSYDYKWDVSTNAWQNFFRSFSQYDAMGNDTNFWSQLWNDSVINWYDYQHIFSTYDANNNQTDSTYLIWNPFISGWTNFIRNFYYYNGSNQEIAHKIQTGSGTSWNNVDSTSNISMDLNGNVLVQEMHQWQTSIPYWQYKARYTMNYNSFSLEAFRLIEVYDNFTNSFNFLCSGSMTYNSYNQLLTSDMPFIINYSPVGYFNYFTQNYYQNNFVGINKSNTHGGTITAQVFPNPSAESLNLSIIFTIPEDFSISIFDATGKVYQNLQVHASRNCIKKINTDNLPSGMYRVLITGSKDNCTIPFIVNH